MSQPTSAHTSLGDLAVQGGLIPEVVRQTMADELRAAVHEGAPQSFARLLIRHGHPPEAVSALLASGQSLTDVRCDACGASVPSSSLPDRAEYPCVCGSMLLGFSPFAGHDLRPGTDRYPSVMPIPPKPNRGTLRYDKVHELPPPSSGDDNNSTGPYQRILPLPAPEAEDRFQALLTAPLHLPEDEGDDDLGGLTLSPEELARLKGDSGSDDAAQMTMSEDEYQELLASNPQFSSPQRPAATSAGPPSPPPAAPAAPSLMPLIVTLVVLVLGLVGGVVALVLD